MALLRALRYRPPAGFDPKAISTLSGDKPKSFKR